jgi:hypothetical protein
MKLYFIVFFFIVSGLIFLGLKPKTENRQAQEEAPQTEQISKNTFRIRLDINSDRDKSMSDILWFQKAAEVAIEQKIPWFNVLEQNVTSSYVEGLIELERDPMKAEYDANEILSLNLTDERI